MKSRSEKTVSGSPGSKQIVVDFDPKNLKAPFLLRCGALLIDYILMVAIPVISLLIGRYLGMDGGKLLDGSVSNIGWLIAILVGVVNFLILPIFNGQTIGKMLTGIRIVSITGEFPTFSQLVLRNIVGYFLTALTGMLGFFLAIFNIKGRALHDFVSGTVVIYGQQRPIVVTKEAL
jgi:uncharacterized RDD family membrane protein YckC